MGKKIEGRILQLTLVLNLKRKRQYKTAGMELESIMPSEISQAVRDKYHMTSPLTGT